MQKRIISFFFDGNFEAKFHLVNAIFLGEHSIIFFEKRERKKGLLFYAEFFSYFFRNAVFVYHNRERFQAHERFRSV